MSLTVNSNVELVNVLEKCWNLEQGPFNQAVVKLFSSEVLLFPYDIPVQGSRCGLKSQLTILAQGKEQPKYLFVITSPTSYDSFHLRTKNVNYNPIFGPYMFESLELLFRNIIHGKEILTVISDKLAVNLSDVVKIVHSGDIYYIYNNGNLIFTFVIFLSHKEIMEKFYLTMVNFHIDSITYNVIAIDKDELVSVHII